MPSRVLTKPGSMDNLQIDLVCYPALAYPALVATGEFRHYLYTVLVGLSKLTLVPGRLAPGSKRG